MTDRPIFTDDNPVTSDQPLNTAMAMEFSRICNTSVERAIKPLIEICNIQNKAMAELLEHYEGLCGDPAYRGNPLANAKHGIARLQEHIDEMMEIIANKQPKRFDDDS